MATITHNTPAGVNDTAYPATNPIAFAIHQHRRAYAAWLGTLERLNRLREDFDREGVLDDPDAKREVMTAAYGQDAPAKIAAYFAVEEAANAAGWDEDEAWRRFEALAPGSREDLTTWLSYVQEHAGQEQDIVTLGMALRKVGAMLAERLAG